MVSNPLLTFGKTSLGVKTLYFLLIISIAVGTVFNENLFYEKMPN